MDNVRNIVWEDKGIVLGIILYLLKNKNLKKMDIILQNKRYRFIMKHLFKNYSFRSRGVGFKINIKNSDKSDVIINNINNLEEVNGQKIVLLPWYDEDNPIIMFEYIKNKSDSLSKIKSWINKHNSNRHLSNGIPTNFIEQKCPIQNWDTKLEYKILAKYAKKYKKNVVIVYKFINEVLTYACNKDKVALLPYIVDRLVKSETGAKTEQQIDSDSFDKIIKDVTTKINSTNQLLELKKDIFNK